MENYILLTNSDDGADTRLVISVAREYLRWWIVCSEFESLEEIRKLVSITALENLASCAERAGFLAFSYRPNADSPFHFPEFCRGEALVAFADFLSHLLNENGHIESSKYLDALLEL